MDGFVYALQKFDTTQWTEYSTICHLPIEQLQLFPKVFIFGYRNEPVAHPRLITCIQYTDDNYPIEVSAFPNLIRLDVSRELENGASFTEFNMPNIPVSNIDFGLHPLLREVRYTGGSDRPESLLGHENITLLEVGRSCKSPLDFTLTPNLETLVLQMPNDYPHPIDLSVLPRLKSLTLDWGFHGDVKVSSLVNLEELMIGTKYPHEMDVRGLFKLQRLEIRDGMILGPLPHLEYCYLSSTSSINWDFFPNLKKMRVYATYPFIASIPDRIGKIIMY